MKKLLYILFFIPFIGCGDFLDEVDQDKLVPEKTDHYAALLLSEFNYNYPVFTTVNHMTDNVVENSLAYTSQKEGAKTTYTWQREIEIDEDGNTLNGINNSWENMYEDIAIANYVIELIDDAIGTQEEINYVKGEAYFIRALSYFNLLNLYGQPYAESTASVELGVPIRDNIGVEVTYSRNTVQECYDFIEKDIERATELIAASQLEKSIWHPSVEACYLLMSRVKLYQEKWDECITWSEKVIQLKKLSRMYENRVFLDEDNHEILYSYHNTNPAFSTSSAYVANKELISMYEDKDVRKSLFFTEVDNGTGTTYFAVNKYSDSYTSVGFTNFKVVEAHLNRAEAYAQKGQTDNALNDIKTIHEYRYSSTTDIEYPTESSEVLIYVLDERRKEFCFEDHHRWFDLRRMNDRPVIKHVFTLVSEDGTKLGTETYTLLSNDYNYTLPIPLKERENNPLIRNNERYEKIPEVDNEIIIP